MPRLQRTQVYLDREVTDELDRLARERGTTRSDLIRLATRQFVEQERSFEDDPIFDIIGMGSSDGAPVAEHHHEYLVDEELRRWTR